MTKVQKSVEVAVPVRTAYDQWTQFEEFPQFMSGVQQVEQLDERTMRWVAEIAGVRRQWIATVLEQVPDEKVAWAATEGATNAGAVTFEPLGADRTRVNLVLDYEPEGVVEKAGDALNIVDRQASGDLERFKSFIEARGTETGGWRGEVTDEPSVGTPDVEDAAASRGDSGKAGVSGTEWLRVPWRRWPERPPWRRRRSPRRRQSRRASARRTSSTSSRRTIAR